LAAAEEEDSEQVDKSAAIDSGTDVIDVSNYTKEMQTSYKVVEDKCSYCHSMSRVINSEYALPNEWKRYVKRMRRKPGSGITKGNSNEIVAFLIYDSQQRKSELIEKKLSMAGSGE